MTKETKAPKKAKTKAPEKVLMVRGGVEKKWGADSDLLKILKEKGWEEVTK